MWDKSEPTWYHSMKKIWAGSMFGTSGTSLGLEHDPSGDNRPWEYSVSGIRMFNGIYHQVNDGNVCHVGK